MLPADCDVLIVGAGPAGSACAIACARSGRRVLVLDRARFPREKVCGDCINPSAWPVLERLGVAAAVRSARHAVVRRVDLEAMDGFRRSFALPESPRGEITMRRSVLDAVLLDAARAAGAEVIEGAVLTGVDARGAVRTAERAFSAKWIVAADGRNSTVARLLGILPPAQRGRVAWQAHIPAPGEIERAVRMAFHPEGYSGLADLGGGQANLCLVARPSRADDLRRRAVAAFDLGGISWQTVAPVGRAAIHPRKGAVLFAGDAARVVEPFTGEGIAYALASGELAGRLLANGAAESYAEAHRRLYAGRLWIHELARLACLHPRAGSLLLRAPWLARWLTRKITAPATPTALEQRPPHPPLLR
jgi:geranylgeranyl reductase family protein